VKEQSLGTLSDVKLKMDNDTVTWEHLWQAVHTSAILSNLCSKWTCFSVYTIKFPEWVNIALSM